MDGISEWGYGVIHALQAYRNPLADALFRALSFTGDEEFFLILIPVLYWLVDKRLATRFALLFLLSVYLNTLLKALASMPRPSPARVAVLAEPGGGGMPSGHAQNAMALWGYLATESTKRWFRGAMAALIFGVGLSRLYLGVHFPTDVLGGWGVGALLLLAFLALAPRVGAWLAALPVAARAGAGGGLALLLALLFPAENAVTAMATLCGLALGVPLEREWVGFGTRPRGALEALGRLLLGVVILLLIWRGLKPLLEPFGLVGDFLRYTLLGLWVSVGAPWAFVRSGLARLEAPRPILQRVEVA